MERAAKKHEIEQAFREIYGRDAEIYRAPGRVNLIGEHTDYNDGFVMPAAIDSYTWVAIAPREDRKIRLRSTHFPDPAEFDLNAPNPQRERKWSDYPHGVAVMLEAAGYRLRGADILIQGEVPIGAGLSSSAAIEVSTGLALVDQSGITIDREELAKICQRAENEFVGMRSGLMDQFISCFGQPERALMLDCRSLEYKLLPLPEDVTLVVCNTMVKHELGKSEYNTRRAECEEGVRILAGKRPEIKALRDVSIEELERSKGELSDVVYKRCRHVITENKRVLDAATALEAEDLRKFGELMYASHQSLRNDYEVSCKELDMMVDLASHLDGVYGARMTGGGFGGCTVNLVESDSAEAFRKDIATGYENRTRIKPDIYTFTPAAGAEKVTDEQNANFNRA
jgi:galactokinase